jgi:hypothetical protein
MDHAGFFEVGYLKALQLLLVELSSHLCHCCVGCPVALADPCPSCPFCPFSFSCLSPPLTPARSVVLAHEISQCRRTPAQGAADLNSANSTVQGTC